MVSSRLTSYPFMVTSSTANDIFVFKWYNLNKMISVSFSAYNETQLPSILFHNWIPQNIWNWKVN